MGGIIKDITKETDKIKILNKYPMRYLYHLVKKKGIHTGINILLKVEAEEQRCFIELGSYIYRSTDKGGQNE